MKKIVLNIFLLAITAPLFSGGNTSVDVLKNDVSPKAVSMGGSYAAICDDVYSIYYNPAGLGQLPSPEISFNYSGGFEDAKTNYLAFGTPLPVKGFAGLDKGVLAVSFHTTSLGDFNYRYINYDGTIYSKTVDAEKNTIITLAYAEKVSEGDVKFESYKAYVEQYLGLGFKYVKSTLLEDDDPPTTFAVDAGYKAVEPKLGLSFGLSLLNTMGAIKYVEEKYSLPTILRAGLSWKKPTVMEQQVTLSAEYDKFINDDDASLKFGVEYHLQQVLNFRLGYKMMEENSGFSFGLGLFSGDFSLDFASSMLAVYNSSSISLSYRFDNFFTEGTKTRKIYKEEKKKKRPEREQERSKEPSREKKSKPASEDFFWIY
ncbi:MAG: hypothetical protein COT17_07070 [Elusimicrobia bacterium CG08_land_8_20_14_0_20_51_18]|nr:MAG: hypothetical protein COT17_07070 [Elusimicrobia bacterium CG08_land_8_20_14_0_20_51_18]